MEVPRYDRYGNEIQQTGPLEKKPKSEAERIEKDYSALEVKFNSLQNEYAD